MKFKYLLCIIVCMLIYSCSQIEFVYKDKMSLTNPIYNKTKYNVTGKEISLATKHIRRHLGNNRIPEYFLNINITENKTKKSVKKNQAVSKVDYELVFTYSLENVNLSCAVFKKEITTRFSYIPKASGYNFGSDRSLENMYGLSANENINQFVNYLTDLDLKNCIDEN